MLFPVNSVSNGYEALLDKEREIAMEKIYSLICILFKRKFNSVQFLKILVETPELHDLFTLCLGASHFQEAVSWYVKNVVDLRSQVNPKNIFEK